MFDRPINRSLWTIAAIIVCIILIGVAAGVMALNRRDQATTMLRVPQDYASIQSAINAAQDGDVIQVQPGTYQENVLIDKAVILLAANFDPVNPTINTAVINGGGGTAAITIAPNLLQWPAIRGFVIQGGNNGIHASSPFIAEFNLFHSSVIAVNYQWGSGGSNRNNIYFKAGDDAIHLEGIDRPLLLENNRILYSGDDGIEFHVLDKPSPPGPMEINIRNNMIIGSREDGIQLIDYPGDPQNTNRRFVIVGNLIANNFKAGVGLMPDGNPVEDFSGADMQEAVHVFHNTFYGNNHAISGGDNLVAFNNIIANSTGRGVWRVEGAPGANAAVAYTLFHNNALDADQTTLGTGIFVGEDPLFVAAPNPGPDGAWETIDDDFSGLLLQGNSPAIDRGTAQYATVSGELVPSVAMTGFAGAAPDLGWRELGSPLVITPTASPVPSPTLAISLTPVPTFTFTASPIPSTPTVVTVTPVPSITPLPPSPTVSVPTPVPATSTLTPLPTPTQTPQPTILNLTPNTAEANTTVNVTITGSGFTNGAVVVVEGGQGTPPQVLSTQVINPTSIVVSLRTAMDAGFGTQQWDVRVTNANNTFAVLADAFTVAVPP